MHLVDHGSSEFRFAIVWMRSDPRYFCRAEPALTNLMSMFTRRVWAHGISQDDIHLAFKSSCKNNNRGNLDGGGREVHASH